MPDNIQDIADYYNNHAEHEAQRLVQHQLERELTWRYLEQHLPASGNILEVGAATGSYTLALAQRGYQVTAVDLSPILLAHCQQNLQAAGLESQVELVAADARDLSALQQDGFAAALLMGPLYHLIEETDRQQAIRQVHTRLRPGGVLFSAFISRYGILGDLLQDSPGWIEDEQEARSLLGRGRRPDEYPRGGFRGYFARVEEIAPLHEALGFTTRLLAAVEPVISSDDEIYNRLQGSIRQHWQDLLFEISREPSLLGASRHLLYIGVKNQE